MAKTKGDEFDRGIGKEKVIDLLEGSQLEKGVIVRDVLRYGLEKGRIEAGLSLPRRTLECYY